jgi:hypothetical protein
MGDDPQALPRHAGEARHPRLSNDVSVVPDESKSMVSGISICLETRSGESVSVFLKDPARSVLKAREHRKPAKAR